jgi:hypothetical protein
MSFRLTPDSAYRPHSSRVARERYVRLLLVAATAGLLALTPLSARAQAPSRDDDMVFRLGVTAGGIGLVGLSFEFRWGDRSIDTNLATFGFNDVSVAVTGKQYFGGGDLQPFIGVGLWGVTAFPEDPTQQTGQTLLLRIPVGADWSFADDHSLGVSLALNEGLWIQRGDPTDDTPISHRPIPLPGFYYRVKP